MVLYKHTESNLLLLRRRRHVFIIGRDQGVPALYEYFPRAPINFCAKDIIGPLLDTARFFLIIFAENTAQRASSS